MSKKLIFLFCFAALFFVKTATAQTTKELEARSEYLAAETAYNAADYTRSLRHLDECVKILGATNPKIQYLIVKSLYNAGRYTETKTALDTYFSITDAEKTDAEKYNEMTRLIAENKEKLRLNAVSEDLKAQQRAADRLSDLKKLEKDSLAADRKAKREEARKPIKEWGGFTWGVYARAGIGMPFHSYKAVQYSSAFEKWCKNEQFNTITGGTFEIGTATLFRVGSSNNFRLGFDWTALHSTTFGQGGYFFYQGPSGSVSVKTAPIALLGTHIGPTVGVRLAKGFTLRAAYQICPSSILGGGSTNLQQTFDNRNGFVRANISQTQNPVSLLHAYALTLKYRPLTLTAKFINGTANADYRLAAEDSSYSSGYTYSETRTAFFDINTLMVALGLSF